MPARSYQRGHPIEYADKWVYSDDGTPISEVRSCIRCGLDPTPEGHDACLGDIPGIKSACCGHGVTRPIMRR